MELNTSFIELADDDYAFLRDLIYEHSRIHLGPDKKALVTSRLAKRLRALHLPDYHEYCRLLRSPAGAEEMRSLIDRISTNHTHFFREIKHFDFLRDRALPEWRKQTAGRREVFRLWSAASSSGEEPYSLAICLAEHLAPASSGAWQIDGTDISTRVLDLATQAVYSEDRLNDIPADWLHRYFQKGVGQWAGQFRVKDEVRQRVHFHHLNLLEPGYPFSQPFDVVFCRNVMIYFDRPTQEALVANLTQTLRPGGYLMVGHSESLNGIRHALKLVQPAIYRKP